MEEKEGREEGSLAGRQLNKKTYNIVKIDKMINRQNDHPYKNKMELTNLLELVNEL